MYFIGDTSNKGCYFWWSDHHNGWITANLDFQKASLHNALATFQLTSSIDPKPLRCILGEELIEDENVRKYLIARENLIHFIRKYKDELDFKILMVYLNNGGYSPYGKEDIKLEEYGANVLKNNPRRSDD